MPKSSGIQVYKLSDYSEKIANYCTKQDFYVYYYNGSFNNYQVFKAKLFLMHPSDSLFELIHSLKKEEKRQFKLYVKKYSKASNFLLLFDAISRMKRYDEELLRRQLSGKHFSERLGVAKEYLYSLVLRSLRDLEPITAAGKVYKLIEDISLLLDRRLYAQAKKKIRKAKELAIAYDLFGERHILLDLEAYLPESDRKEIIQDLEMLLKQTNENFEVGGFAESMREFRELKGSVRTEEDAEEIKSILASLRYHDAEELMTFGAKLRYHFGWARYYEIIKNSEEAFRSVEEIIDLYDRYPQFIQTEPLGYITSIMNLCTYRLGQGKGESNGPFLEKVRKLQTSKQFTPYSELLLFRYEILEATLLFDWKRIDKLHAGLPSLLERNGAEANSFGKDIRIDYHLYFAKAFFLQKKFEKALDEINAVLKLPTLKDFPSYENNARVLQIIVHYELGNLSYLPYLIRSTYRALLRRERLYEFESCILHYLASLSRLKKQEDMLPSFGKLLAEIEVLAAQPVDREFPWREFYIEWLENKIREIKKDDQP